MEPRDPSFQTPAATGRSRQFSIWQLLCWTAVAALMCAPLAYFESYPGHVLFAWTGLAGIILLRITGKTNLVEMFVLVGILCFLVAIMMPAVHMGPRVPSHRSHCMNNIRNLSMALHYYHDQHGSFPPAYIADENGNPMHSWRVLILPYIEERDLYDQYDFDEPWDGPNNSLLHDKVVDLFNCPYESGQTDTTYVAIVGDGTAWPGPTGATYEDFARDGMAGTIHLVETHNSGIHWMEPRDLDFATMATTINQGPPGRCISSHHGAGANVAMADGSVHFLPDTISGKTVQSLVTIEGGEIVNPDDF